MKGRIQAIVINEKDNVAVAIELLNTGTTVFVETRGCIEKIALLSNIPKGHKFALRDLNEGEAVIKYGEPIGQCTVKIPRGEHVHVHDMVSQPR